MRIYTVTIRKTYGDCEEYETRVRAIDETDARARAIRKLYGARCHLHQDTGLPVGYGQIVRTLTSRERSRRASDTTWAADCITGRVCVEVV